MKSSHKNSPLSNVFSGFALALVAVVGFFTVGTMLPKQQSQEAVLGASSHTSTVTTVVNGVKYRCQRTDCEKVENISWTNQNALDDSQGDVCESKKDSSGKNVCYWATGHFTTHQCNVDTSVYRNKKYKGTTTPGGINQAISGRDENIVYYNCIKIVPPTPSPTKMATPTPYKCYVGYGKACGYGKCNYAGQGTAYCQGSFKCISGKCSFPATPTPRKPSNVR